MSAISLVWILSLKRIGNQTAKQLLQFYASHNFGKPGFEFKNETLAEHLDVSVRAIQKAYKFLLDKKLIIREYRYSKSGRQLTSIIYLNIPKEFVDNYFGEGERSSPQGGTTFTPRGELRSPLNNKLNNKSNNKKRASRSVIHTKKDQMRSLNPFADVENQSNSWDQKKQGNTIKVSSFVKEAVHQMNLKMKESRNVQ